MKTRDFSMGLLAMMVMLGWPLVAAAHVHMEKSSPENGAHLSTAPEKVQMWFSGRVAAEWSKVKVTDAAGKRMDTGEISDDGDPEHLSVKLQPLPAGEYKVKLNVISGDGHRVKGSFRFTVE